MAGYQFAHVEGYSLAGSTQNKKTKGGGVEVQKTRSLREIAEENMREAGACPHVENPETPTIIYGVSPLEVVPMAEDWASQTQDAKGRKLRKDANVCLAGVISLPREREEEGPEFFAHAVNYLKEKYDDRLKSVVFHEDEAHPHIHFFILPRVGEKFEDIHEGVKASNKAKAEGKAKGEQNQAYKAAMRGWQDEFSNKVAKNFGLTRLGPGRRRLSRKAWVAEQKQAEYFSDVKKVASKGYKRGFKKGFQEGLEKGVEVSKNIGQKVASAVAGWLGGFHKPTTQAQQEVRTAQKKAEEAEKKRLQEVEQAKREADKRVVKIAQEMQKAKSNNEGLMADLDRKDADLQAYASAVAYLEKKYGEKLPHLPKLDK